LEGWVFSSVDKDLVAVSQFCGQNLRACFLAKKQGVGVGSV
jgi:hypothetical protein